MCGTIRLAPMLTADRQLPVAERWAGLAPATVVPAEDAAAMSTSVSPAPMRAADGQRPAARGVGLASPVVEDGTP